jgi:hypothetical protein
MHNSFYNKAKIYVCQFLSQAMFLVTVETGKVWHYMLRIILVPDELNCKLVFFILIGPSALWDSIYRESVSQYSEWEHV